ncbi:MFS transporter [Amycolatopsis sp. lyj-109]|uniref:MFS transporter n=1 Tax=Amycolatopsis sp. lyj-109 TaxID=2789287 RepID=UPI00397CD56B
MSRLFSPLRHRRFRTAWAGQLVNVTGDAGFTVVVALYLLPRPDAARALGLVLGLTALGGVVSLLFGGVLADRCRRTRVVVASDLLRATGLVLIIVTGAGGPLVALGAGAVLMGAGSGIYRPAYSALLPSLVPRNEFRGANALRSATNRVATVVGAGLGGVTAAAVGPRGALWIDAATFVASTATMLSIREPRAAASRVRGGALAEAREGITYVLGRPWMSAILVQGLVQLTFVVAPITILLPFAIGSDGTSYGLVVAVEGVGAVLGAALAARVTTTSPGLLSMAALLAQVPQTVTLALHGPAVLLAVFGFFTGTGLSVFGVLWMTALQTGTPGTHLGRVLSLDALVNSALTPLAIVVVGWLLPAVGTTMFAWIAAVMLVVSIVAVLPVRGVTEFADAQAPNSHAGQGN